MPAARVARARVGVAAVFFINGFSFASWIPRIAEVKTRLQIGEGELGLALFAVASGALLAMPLTGALATRYGSRLPTTLALVLFLLSPIGWSMAPSLAWLALGFLAIGITAGSLDVAMNAQAVTVESAASKPIMSSLHGFFSLGGMAGALAAGAIIGAGTSLVLHMVLVAVLAVPLGLLACGTMLADRAEAHAGGPAFAWPTRGLLPIGVIAFCALLIEGAIADWSAVYMTEALGSPAVQAAWAFAAFQTAMAGGRFLGDRVIAALGRPRVARAGGTLAAIGLAGALLLDHPVAAIAGFALVGIGISATFPITVSAAAARGEMPPGHAVAAIATLGYTGFLVGPPTIGALAEAIGLPLALGLLPLLSLLVVALGGRLKS